MATQSARKQCKWWIVTASARLFYFEAFRALPDVEYSIGQQEIGEGGFHHYQFVVCFKRKLRRNGVRLQLGEHHVESVVNIDLAIQYVRKLETAIPDTQFEFGFRPRNPASQPDWEAIWSLACAGKVLDIPPRIRFSHYRTIRQLAGDFATPNAILKTVHVYWGESGTGKSRTAWGLAGARAFPKDPRSKFWFGYGGEEMVVIDEFRGGIDISHVLRWTDRYPVIVETKHGAMSLSCHTIFITSNLHPRNWYPDLSSDPLQAQTLQALLRRLTITEFSSVGQRPEGGLWRPVNELSNIVSELALS